MKLTLMRILGVLLAALMAVGCSVGGTARAVGALPAGQVVFMVSSGGGLVPPIVYALDSPSLVIYGDGRILSAVNATTSGVPARYRITRVDPLAVASFVSETEGSGIINPDKDFGMPGVTDMDSTTVLVHGENGQAKVSVYAFHDEFEDHVTPRQQAARAALGQVIDTATNLAASGSPAPYAPDRVVVYDLGPNSGTPATTPWPGPAPASFLAPSTRYQSVGCGYLTGAAATAAYGAALDNPGALWLVDGATRILAVNPLPVGDACP